MNASTGQGGGSPGLIPYQELLNRRREPITCLEWVPGRDVLSLAPFLAFPETFHQLTETFPSLALGFGLALPELAQTLPQFKQACTHPGYALVKAPRLYLLGRDTPHFLVFDWARWMTDAKFVLSDDYSG